MFKPQFTFGAHKSDTECGAGLVERTTEHDCGIFAHGESAHEAFTFLQAERQRDFQAAALGGKLCAIGQNDPRLERLIGVVVPRPTPATRLFAAAGLPPLAVARTWLAGIVPTASAPRNSRRFNDII